jgi:hypothetical protein
MARANPCDDCPDFTKCYQQSCRISLTAHQRKKRLYNYKLIGRWKQTKGCVMCGYNKHPAALHVDHIDPSTKTMKGGKAWHPNWSKQRIKKELAKCQILCANCHFERSYIERHYERNNDE